MRPAPGPTGSRRWPESSRSAFGQCAGRSSSVDAPDGVDPSAWPFVHSVGNDFYMMPEAGRLLVSPVDEIDDDPCDAQPEDYDSHSPPTGSNIIRR